ncbi:AraC family transcriptional regulator [Burkholderia sp. PU8-34]
MCRSKKKQKRLAGCATRSASLAPAGPSIRYFVPADGAPDVEPAPPVERVTVPGGEYAVLLHTGPYADLKAAYQWLYGDWLRHSGREAADAPPFELYLNTPMDAAPAELRTEIYLPLR